MKMFLCFLVGATLFLTGCGASAFKTTNQKLQPLLATNAPLSVVEATMKEHFQIERRGSKEWDGSISGMKQTGVYESAGFRELRAKLEKAEAFGLGPMATSELSSCQTWIFLDKNDRLIDFYVNVQ